MQAAVRSAEREMSAAGVGAREGSFGGQFASWATAARTFQVAHVLSAATDDLEAGLLRAFQDRGLTKPVYDGASGVPLAPGLVAQARAEELGWVQKLHVWDRVPRAAAHAAGKRVVGVKWIDRHQ